MEDILVELKLINQRLCNLEEKLCIQDEKMEKKEDRTNKRISQLEHKIDNMQSVRKDANLGSTNIVIQHESLQCSSKDIQRNNDISLRDLKVDIKTFPGEFFQNSNDQGEGAYWIF